MQSLSLFFSPIELYFDFAGVVNPITLYWLRHTHHSTKPNSQRDPLEPLQSNHHVKEPQPRRLTPFARWNLMQYYNR